LRTRNRGRGVTQHDDTSRPHVTTHVGDFVNLLRPAEA
jgi:hypothetical protein